ncbi:MAG TPA: inositol monophosphatase family protein [Desulfobacterales bacterium]
MDLHAIRDVAVASAYQGAEILRSRFGRLARVEKKGVIDLVTDADLQSEKRIKHCIQSTFPDHRILAEESGTVGGSGSDRLWIVDPLDGTTNYAHRVGLYAVSIAFSHGGRVVVGVVLNPASGELFVAVSGEGATCNGRPIRVSNVGTVNESLLATGFPYNVRDEHAAILARFSACLRAAQGIRRLGSAALDLCWVACGRFEAFWEQYLQPWDTAAGMLLVREAGGRVTDFAGNAFSPEQDEILATNGAVHTEMQNLLRLDPVDTG